MEEGFVFTPQLGMIVGGIVGIIIGWVIGFFDSNRNSSKKIKQAEESAQIAMQEAKDKIAHTEAQLASIAATPSVTVDDPGLLRIKNENGALTLDLDGTRVNPIALYPEQRKRLIEMLNVMRPWLENKPVAMPVTPPPPPPQPVAAPVQVAPPASQAIPQRPAPAQPAKPAAAPAPAPQKDEAPAVAATSMVGQINAILQSRIANTKLVDIGVTMIESPSGGVYVYVGLNKFEGIDAVPDEEIKAAIRAAIAEWERKYTPGL
jgi:hypothetical protein